MPNVAAQPREKVVRAITRAYKWRHLREGGKHTVYCKDGVPEIITIPRHKKISAGVIRNICKILGVTVEEFVRIIRDC